MTTQKRLDSDSKVLLELITDSLARGLPYESVVIEFQRRTGEAVCSYIQLPSRDLIACESNPSFNRHQPYFREVMVCQWCGLCLMRWDEGRTYVRVG